MNDERALLEQRIRWLEWKVARLLWFSITVVSFMAGEARRVQGRTQEHRIRRPVAQ
jgi:hypothetical protein